MAQGERIEDLLESVADAVSALVMFSTESVENKRMMTNIASGSNILKEATNFLVESASKTTSKFLYNCAYFKVIFNFLTFTYYFTYDIY